MPCRDDDLAREDQAEQYRKLERERNDLVTLLCLAMRAIKDKRIPVHRRLDAWWQQHKKEDQERAAEAQRTAKAEEEKQEMLARLNKNFTKKELRSLRRLLDNDMLR